MSFTSYPIITFGSNTDVIRQGHNLLTANLGDMNGLQTAAHETIVDAINSLNSAFSALTVSAYPPLNNEQWLTATTFSGFGTLNLFKLSSGNEFVVGQHIIPLTTLMDLGKNGTAWRVGYITTVNTAKVQAVTNLELASTSTLTFTLNASALILSEVSATQLKLETVAENLDIKSLQTRLFSGTFLWDVTTAGHLEPGVTQVQNVGSAAKEVNRVFTKNITASGDVTFNADVIMPNAGAAMPIGGGCLWFLPAIPNNYLIANGQAVSRTTYAALWSLYGTYYGIGDGVTTFNLPDMRNRFPFGVNTAQVASPDASAPGKVFGTLNHTHNSLMPKHYHSSTGLAVADHINQITGTPSVTLIATFSGSPLPTHGHGITDPGHGHGISEPPGGHSHFVNDPGHRHTSLSRISGGTSSDGFLVRGPVSPNSGTTLDFQTSLNGTGIFLSPSGTGISVVNSGVNGSNISVQGASAGTPSGIINLSNVSHTHTIPTLTHSISGTVGITAGSGGSNGDIDNTLVSSASNPPAFAVHFIIRAK